MNERETETIGAGDVGTMPAEFIADMGAAALRAQAEADAAAECSKLDEVKRAAASAIGDGTIAGARDEADAVAHDTGPMGQAKALRMLAGIERDCGRSMMAEALEAAALLVLAVPHPSMKPEQPASDRGEQILALMRGSATHSEALRGLATLTKAGGDDDVAHAIGARLLAIAEIFERDTCLQRLLPGEVFFVLRAVDLLAPIAIRAWAQVAQSRGVCSGKIAGALRIAERMEEHPNRRLPG